MLARPGDEWALQLRSVRGGLLAQTPDFGAADEAGWQVVTARQPSDEELSRAALCLARRQTRQV